MRFRIVNVFFLTLFLSGLTSLVFSQKIADSQTDGRSGNIITTAIPILGVSPDARSGAMGDVGVAISTACKGQRVVGQIAEHAAMHEAVLLQQLGFHG